MTQKSKILSRLLVDSSSLAAGLAIGLLYLKVFRGGVSFPLENSDSLVLIFSAFTAILLSSIFHKAVGRMGRSVQD